MPRTAVNGLTILVVDDDALLRKQVVAYLQSLGADARPAGTVAQARKAITETMFDLALVDVRLPDGLGTDLLGEQIFSPNCAVIIMTADGAVNGAVDAMRLGALDYLVKPFDLDELPLVVQRARRSRQTARLEEHRRDTAQDPFFFGAALQHLAGQMDKIIAADSRVQTHLPPVLIEGETGTGKTTIARLLHQRGPRAEQPLVEVNCSALPETLAESELFGHERGAFTDARTARIGLFEAAQGGTLFLDELPSLSLPLQAKVLKVVEDHRLRRLGGNRELPIDVRIIAATHRDLKELIGSGHFREDLFHRLDLYRLRIPPLRQRGQDIIELARTLAAQLFQRHHIPPREFSAAGGQKLLAYRWPGNVRELAHELERSIVFEESAQLEFAALNNPSQPGSGALGSHEWFNPGFVFPAEGFDLEEANRRLINHALNQTGHNVSAAARLLSVSRDYLRYRLSGVQPEESGPATGPEPPG